MTWCAATWKACSVDPVGLHLSISFWCSVALIVDSKHPEKIVGIGRAWKLSLAFSVPVLALFLLHPCYLAALGNFLVTPDRQLEKADAIIVLAGGSPRDERLLHAVHLWQSGYAPVVVVTLIRKCFAL